MSAPTDGGPAFPVPGMPPVGTGDPRDGMASGCDPLPGMSLRDWFAGQALTKAVEFGESPKCVAMRCYALADAMLAARKEADHA